MRIEELELICQEAARNVVARHARPLPATVVLPLPEATRVISLEGFPDDDPGRFDLLAAFARDTMRPANAACYGFLAEASAAGTDGRSVDVLMVAYGARRHRARVLAAPLQEGVDGAAELGEFTASEELDPTALPFLSPLQHAVDEAAPVPGAGPGPLGGPLGGPGEEPGGGLPILGA